jgi:hypothetical protein
MTCAVYVVDYVIKGTGQADGSKVYIATPERIVREICIISAPDPTLSASAQLAVGINL